MVAWASLSEWLGNTKHRLRMGGLTSDSLERPRAAVFAAIGAPDHIAAPDCLLDEACEDDGYETVLLSPSLEDTDEGLSGAATAAATAFINKAKGCRPDCTFQPFGRSATSGRWGSARSRAVLYP